MSSQIKLINANGKILSIGHHDLLIKDKNVMYVDSVDDLTNLSDSNDNDVVVVTDKDRGGIFLYDSSKSSENDSGIVFNGWCRQYNDIINVKWFGAVGDGITDDTEPMEKACALLDSIYFDDSLTFYIKNTLTINNYSILGLCNIITDKDNGIILKSYEVDSLKIKRATLDTNENAIGDQGGISCRIVNNTNIKNLTSINFSTGIYIEPNNNKVFIDNLYIEAFGRGLWLSRKNNYQDFSSAYINHLNIKLHIELYQGTASTTSGLDGILVKYPSKLYIGSALIENPIEHGIYSQGYLKVNDSIEFKKTIEDLSSGLKISCPDLVEGNMASCDVNKVIVAGFYHPVNFEHSYKNCFVDKVFINRNLATPYYGVTFNQLDSDPTINGNVAIGYIYAQGTFNAAIRIKNSTNISIKELYVDADVSNYIVISRESDAFNRGKAVIGFIDLKGNSSGSDIYIGSKTQNTRLIINNTSKYFNIALHSDARGTLRILNGPNKTSNGVLFFGRSDKSSNTDLRYLGNKNYTNQMCFNSMGNYTTITGILINFINQPQSGTGTLYIKGSFSTEELNIKAEDFTDGVLYLSNLNIPKNKFSEIYLQFDTNDSFTYAENDNDPMLFYVYTE